MARIKFGAIVTEGSGSLGGHTLQHSEGGNQIRTKPLPNKNPSSPQYNIRRKIPCLQYSWKALSAIQKTVWDRYAVDHDIRSKKGDHEILSGHSLWMKYQYYNWTEECNLPVDPAAAQLLVPPFDTYVPPPFQPPIVPVFPPHVNPPDKPTIAISGYLSLCEGQSVSLISSYGDFYLWSTGATTHTITVNTPGSYTVKVGNVGNLWSVDSDPTVVSVGYPPTAPVITVTDYLPGPVDDPHYILLIGEGSFATLTSEEAESYIWSTGEITRSIQVLATGFYTVRVANVQGCLSSVSERITVQSFIRPPQPVITPSGPLEFCDGGSVNLECSEADTYLWSTDETTRTITVTDSGSYTVIIENAAGYESIPSAATVVIVNETPVQPVITPSGPTEFCDGGSVDLECSLSDSYLWSTAETTRTITVSVAGSYTVQVENANGCQSIPSEATEVIVNEVPAQPIITPSGPLEFCEGGSVDLECSLADSYLWSTAETTRTITVTDSGNYTVQVENAYGCQSIPSEAAEVIVNDVPAQPVITPSGPLEFCEGGSVDLECSLADSYLWSTTETTRTITVTVSGNYTVQIENSNGCQSIPSEAVEIIVNDVPAQPEITPSGPTEFCDGGSVDLECSLADSYLWSTAETTRTITVNESGNYTVQVENADGCQSIQSEATAITVNEPPAKPTITPSGPLDIPSGGSVDLESSEGTTYLWSNAETTRTITVSASGNYTVQVYDANGCISSASDAAVVTVYDRGFKTRWVVAGDFTARTITLPLKANRSEGALAYDFIVSWGDGSTGHVTAWNDALKTHTYINSGTYDVEIWGTCEGWSFGNGASRNKITRVLDWGVSAGFNGFKFLKQGFYGCNNLLITASGGPLASGTGCLTDGFENFLLDCYAITSLDSDLFRLHPNVSTNAFRGALAGMENLLTLPVDLFRYNVNASSHAFHSVCGDCYLLETIPTDIFKYNILVSDSAFELAFCNDEALTTLPVDLFRYNILASNRAFYETFAGCLLLATMNANLFKYNVLAIVDAFRYTFYNCEKLQLRSDIFYGVGESGTRFHDQSPCFDNTFQRQQYTGIQGTAPDLWNCDFGTGTPYTFWCFQGEGNNIDSLTNYNNIPDEWKFEPE